MPQPKNLAINMEGVQVHYSSITFPYPPSQTNEKINLVTRNEYKIHVKDFWEYFSGILGSETRLL